MRVQLKMLKGRSFHAMPCHATPAAEKKTPAAAAAAAAAALCVQAMVKIVTEKLGQDAGSVLAAMMAHACPFETRVNVSGLCCFIVR